MRVDVDAEPGELVEKLSDWVPAVLAEGEASPELVKAVQRTLVAHSGQGEPWPWPLGLELELAVTAAVRACYERIRDRVADAPLLKSDDGLVKAAKLWTTPERLQRLRDIVTSEHAGLAVELFGPGVLSAAQVEQLRQAGILTDAEVDAAGSLLGDAHQLGAAIARDPDRGRNLTLAQARDIVAGSGGGDDAAGGPTMRERQAAVARMRGGQQIVGLGNRVAHDLTTIAISSDDERAMQLRARISEAVAQQAEEGFDSAELHQRIAMALEGDYARDIERIVVTETHAAIQGGVVSDLLDRYGDDVSCAVVPAPGACRTCFKLYTGPDGPHVWRAGALPPSSVNFQRKAADRVACIPPAHPRCRCELVYVPDGWRVSEEGQVLPPLRKSESAHVDGGDAVGDHVASPFTWGRHFKG